MSSTVFQGNLAGPSNNFRIEVTLSDSGINQFSLTFKLYCNIGFSSNSIEAQLYDGNSGFSTSTFAPNHYYNPTHYGVSMLYLSPGVTFNGVFSIAYTGGSGTRYTSTVTVQYTNTVTTHKISYAANGGQGAPNSDMVADGASYTVSATTPNKSGYSFENWTYNGQTYSPGTQISSVNQDYNFTAVWKAIEPTNIRFLYSQIGRQSLNSEVQMFYAQTNTANKWVGIEVSQANTKKIMILEQANTSEYTYCATLSVSDAGIDPLVVYTLKYFIINNITGPQVAFGQWLSASSYTYTSITDSETSVIIVPLSKSVFEVNKINSIFTMNWPIMIQQLSGLPAIGANEILDSNSDLNGYTKPGKYTIMSNSSVSLDNHYPTTLAGSLYVLRVLNSNYLNIPHHEGWDSLVQIYVTYTGLIYTRYASFSTANYYIMWSSWKTCLLIEPPSVEGTYTLQATRNNLGEVNYFWAQ